MHRNAASSIISQHPKLLHFGQPSDRRLRLQTPAEEDYGGVGGGYKQGNIFLSVWIKPNEIMSAIIVVVSLMKEKTIQW
ncbi:hypothetical protein F2P81_015677 [Scophthalmus maximus]|uniref:Uncharacterized protein n=1 Tax=Scophthalmus maximus TaxID=52904 RepID=A0A6A4SLC0_SCOMX|nr:hypothetical protein F2P81_015677 [Scophthalmus maximus]